MTIKNASKNANLPRKQKNRHEAAQDEKQTSRAMVFENNRLLPLVFGVNNRHLEEMEERLGVSITNRGNHLEIAGPARESRQAEEILSRLYRRAEEKGFVDANDTGALLKEQGFQEKTEGGENQEKFTSQGVFRVAGKSIHPRSEGQADYIRAMQTKIMVFVAGLAGTGKTWLAIQFGASLLKAGLVEKLVVTRPAVEAGERLGFLPGDMRDKIDPYFQPIYDAFNDALGASSVERHIARGLVEIIPLAFMRGRTLKNAFILLDEAQNTTPGQMKMFLTRLGHGSRMVIAGDPTQSDLPVNENQKNGLDDALTRFAKLATRAKQPSDIAMIKLGMDSVVRHSLVADIISCYDGNK